MRSERRHTRRVSRLGLLTLVKICYVACLALAVILMSITMLVAYTSQGRLSTDGSLTDLQVLGFVAAICAVWPVIFGGMLGTSAWLGFAIIGKFMTTSIDLIEEITDPEEIKAAQPGATDNPGDA